MNNHWRYLRCPHELLSETMEKIRQVSCWNERERVILMELAHLCREAILAQVDLNVSKIKYRNRRYTN